MGKKFGTGKYFPLLPDPQEVRMRRKAVLSGGINIFFYCRISYAMRQPDVSLHRENRYAKT